MYNEKEPVIEHTPKSFEKMILSELGAQSLEEVTNAMKNGTWPFKIPPKELWKKAVDYFDQPPTVNDIVDLLTGNKTEEEVKQKLEKKQWPFNVSEKQMREIADDLKK